MSDYSINNLPGMGPGNEGAGAPPGAAASPPPALSPDPTAGSTPISPCVRCGACMAVCPLYRLLGREPVVARGKLNLWAAYEEGRLASGELVREVLEFCLLCGACADKCAVGLAVPELLQEGRRQLLEREGRKWSPALLLAYLTYQTPQVIPVAAPLAPLLNRLKSWVGADSGLVMRLWPHLALALQRFPNLSRRPFRAGAPQVLPGRGPKKIAFFVGCGIEALFPRVGEAFLAICRQLGLEVVIPPDQGCCGLLSASIGEAALARDLGRRFLREFGPLPVDYIVTACASCSLHLRRLGDLFQGTPEAAAAARLALKVREASAFLVQEGRYRPAGGRHFPGGVGFHDPCHLHRGQGIIEEPRELLRAALGEAPLEASERVCCGLGGAFGVLQPEISRELGLARVQAFQEVGAQLLTTSCSGCLAQLQGVAGTLPVVHLLEVVAPDHR